MAQRIPQERSAPRVAVIGGGITGLAAAHRLHELDPSLDVTLFEASSRLGGAIETDQADGFLLERSADSFITEPADARELCRRIGFESELIPTSHDYRGAYVVCRGRLVKLPDGFTLMSSARLWPVLTTPLLSWPAKLRLFAEPLIPARRETNDESFATFARRRLGREAYARLAQPLVAGIYTADPERLSMRAALPRFVEMEQRYGSLHRGMRREQSLRNDATPGSGARYGLFTTPRRGLSTLIDALAARLRPERVRLRSPVRQIERAPQGSWRLTIDARPAAVHECDALIITAGSQYAATLVETIDSTLAGDLRRIEYAGCVIALVGYRREQISHALDAFGFVVPEVEGRPILACSFASVKFAGRAPEGCVLLRVFLGGACHPDLHGLDDEQVRRLVQAQLGDLLGARGDPLLFRVARWDHAMPQYHVGHCDLVQRIEAQADRAGLVLAGNAYHGVGIPHCVASGETAAARIVERLARR
jgi:oxygen-dependent protoporphyrinogen oxidase